MRDAAKLFQVSEKTIYRWINQQTVPAYVINGQYRFSRAELLEWATARQIKVSADILAEPESDADPCPGLAEALEVGGIYYRVDAQDRASALRAVVDVMRLPDEVDREFLHDALTARESLGSTGVGAGVAIPHVRNPIVQHVPRPSIALCFLEQPVEFGALDGKPVQALFVVISPTIRAHLHLMARLAAALRDSAFKDAISRQASREEIFTEARRVEASLPEPRAVESS